MKHCIIRKVAFKWPGSQSRLVWAHVLAEHEGLALVLVPKPGENQPHSIFIAEENIAERLFEAVTPHRFDLETQDVKEAGDRLRALAKTFLRDEFKGLWDLIDPDDFS